MCDKIPLFTSALHTVESDIESLKILLQKCKEKTNKPHKCYLITEQISKKEYDAKLIKEHLNKNIQICDLYQNLDKELDELPR